MAKFRKKPVIIDAWKVRDLCHAAAAWKELPETIQKFHETGGFVFEPSRMWVTTLKGTMLAKSEDWIIRGINGEFYPCKPDIFEATYQPE